MCVCVWGGGVEGGGGWVHLSITYFTCNFEMNDSSFVRLNAFIIGKYFERKHLALESFERALNKL